MAVKQPNTERPDHTKKITGSQGKVAAQDAETEKFVHSRVDRKEGDVRITGHDLIGDGDFVIPDDVDGLDDPINIGGGNWTVIGVESTDSNNFDITLEYGTLKDDGSFEVDFTFDSGDDARLAGDNSYLHSIRPVRDRVKITFSDTSGGVQNNIQGGVNSN